MFHRTTFRSPPIGWRLAKPYWGLGYATEAAQQAITFGFTQLHLHELVAFTAIVNLNSRAVMERLGMQFDSEFDHPQVPVESGLRRHVLYRLRPPLSSAGRRMASNSNSSYNPPR